MNHNFETRAGAQAGLPGRRWIERERDRALQPHILKISTLESSRVGETLQLEGHLGGPWVEELRRSCDRVLAKSKRLTLDLAGVTFIDHEGVRLLKNLRQTNLELRNCSPFVALRLEEDVLD